MTVMMAMMMAMMMVSMFVGVIPVVIVMVVVRHKWEERNIKLELLPSNSVECSIIAWGQ